MLCLLLEKLLVRLDEPYTIAGNKALACSSLFGSQLLFAAASANAASFAMVRGVCDGVWLRGGVVAKGDGGLCAVVVNPRPRKAGWERSRKGDDQKRATAEIGATSPKFR